MLYTYQYPVNHPLENLNGYFFDFLTNIRACAKNAQFRPAILLPAEFLIIVDNSPKLKKKIKDFFSSFKILSNDQKNTFYDLVVKSQNIQDFFTNAAINCNDTKSTQINAIIGNNSFGVLVSHLFKVTLRSLGIHDHYRAIYNAMPYKVCPFCGVEKMHKSFQEDYDHLAAKRHYPIVAIHMKNLAPMCHTCNSKNKGETDVLHNDDGSRRLFTYPYSQTIAVSIDFTNCVIPQTDQNNVNGNWDISLLPNDVSTRNWDLVFNIKRRYKEDYLEASYEDWLEDFLDGLKLSNIALNSEQDVATQLLSWSDSLTSRKFHSDNFIKGPLFSFLANCGVNSFYSAIMIRYGQKLVA